MTTYFDNFDKNSKSLKSFIKKEKAELKALLLRLKIKKIIIKRSVIFKNSDRTSSNKENRDIALNNRKYFYLKIKVAAVIYN